jgi:hypothetical protein
VAVESLHSTGDAALAEMEIRIPKGNRVAACDGSCRAEEPTACLAR